LLFRHNTTHTYIYICVCVCVCVCVCALCMLRSHMLGMEMMKPAQRILIGRAKTETKV